MRALTFAFGATMASRVAADPHCDADAEESTMLQSKILQHTQVKTPSYDCEVCRQLAEDKGLEVDSSYFEGDWEVKGCYVYTTGVYQCQVFCGGGTQEEAEAQVNSDSVARLDSAYDPPDQCVAYDCEDCQALVEEAGLSVGGGGYDFEGDYHYKGCYFHTSGDHQCQAFCGTGTVAEANQPIASSSRMRLDAGAVSELYDILPEQCWYGRYDCDRCRSMATRMGFLIGYEDTPTSSWAFEDDMYATKGCYVYTEGPHECRAFCGGGSVMQAHEPTSGSRSRLKHAFSVQDQCTMYDCNECQALAAAKGLTLGNEPAGHEFADDDYVVKGCYTYTSGPHQCHAFCGRGSVAEAQGTSFPYSSQARLDASFTAPTECAAR